MKWLTIVGALVLLLAAGGAAHADSLQVAKADTLSGTLLKVADGNVHFRTKMAGNLIVPADEVVKLATDDPVVAVLKDGSRVEGRLAFDGRIARIKPEDAAAKSLPLDKIATIEPAAPDKPAHRPVDASLETGVLRRYGQDDYTDLFTRLKLSGRFDEYLFDADLFAERADPADFPRWLSAETQWRLHPDRLWQPALGLQFERDTDKALRSRTNLTLGLVRTFPGSDFEAQIGLQAETSQWRTRRHDPSRQDLNLRLALHYTRQIFENGSFTSSMSFTPSLTDLDSFRASSESSLAFPFAARLTLKLNLLIDYENYPQLQDLPEWRTTVGASVLWDF